VVVGNRSAHQISSIDLMVMVVVVVVGNRSAHNISSIDLVGRSVGRRRLRRIWAVS
jgi:hypothetical protein